MIEQIASSVVGTAFKLVAKVRKGPSTRHAFIAAGAMFTRQFDLDCAADLGRIIKHIHDQKFYFDFVLIVWASNTPSIYYECSAISVRGRYLQSRAAMYRLEVESNHHRVLTESQLRQMRQYFNKEDSDELRHCLRQTEENRRTKHGYNRPAQISQLEPDMNELLHRTF